MAKSILSNTASKVAKKVTKQSLSNSASKAKPSNFKGLSLADKAAIKMGGEVNYNPKTGKKVIEKVTGSDWINKSMSKVGKAFNSLNKKK